MREGGKKTFRKKKTFHFFSKNAKIKNKKIKKTLDKFLEKLMRATKKTSRKNIAGKKFFIS